MLGRADLVRAPRWNQEVNAAVHYVRSGEYPLGIGNETGVESLHGGDSGAALRSQINQVFAEVQRAGLAAAERMRDPELLGRATLVPTDDLVHRDTHAESLRLQVLSEVHVVDDDPPPAARQDIGGWKAVTGAAGRAHPGRHFRCTLGFGVESRALSASGVESCALSFSGVESDAPSQREIETTAASAKARRA